MGLDPGAVVPEHVDVHYYWRTHLRIHIPVITNPQVTFTCKGETLHLKAGECWILDSFYRHSVDNRGDATRVHLVLDTVGSDALWDLIEQAGSGVAEERFVPPGAAPKRPLDFEQINSPDIMSPWEIKSHIAYVSAWVDEDPKLQPILHLLDRFVMAWGGTWALYGASDQGLPQYLRHLTEVRAALAKLGGPPLRMRNGVPLVDSLHRFILANAVAPTKIRALQAAAGRAAHSRMSA
jgi:hypothetical protein